MARSSQKILVISLKYLGDVIAATPALGALGESFPDAKITVALRSGYEEALLGNPHVHNIIPINLSRRGMTNAIKTIFAIRKRNFDMVIALEPGDRESLWVFFSGAKKRIAPAYQPLEFLWNVRVPVREESISYIEYYNRIVQAAGAQVRSTTTEIFISREAAQWADGFLKQIPYTGKSLIGIHPGAREANRRWSAIKFAKLLDMLSNRKDVQPLLLCGRGEKYLLDEIVSHAEDAPSLILAPELSIQQTAALMQRCALCITNDSAPRHIAAAVGTRTAATIPLSKVRAWSLYDPALHPTLIGNDANPDSLIDNITADEMYACVAKMLKT